MTSKKSAKIPAKKAPAKKAPPKKTSAKKIGAKKVPAKKTPPQRKLSKKAAKWRKIKHISLGAFAFLSLIIWFGFQPLKAGINYGICRSFVETQVRYPHTYRITEYYELKQEDSIIQKGDHETTIKIFYTHIDAYGGTRSEMIECRGRADPVNGYVMEEIYVNRRPLSEEELAKFNSTIPGIILSGPDLIIPKPPKSDDLAELKRD